MSLPDAFWSFFSSTATFPMPSATAWTPSATPSNQFSAPAAAARPDELTAGIGRLHAMLGFTTIGEIISGDTAAFLHNIREQCLRIHELIYRYYVHYSIQSALAS